VFITLTKKNLRIKMPLLLELKNQKEIGVDVE